MTVEDALRLAVAAARRAVEPGRTPRPGDLVVETSAFLRTPVDPDAIGWLVAHDLAPYGRGEPTDGSVPMREVWDVIPLNPDAELQDFGDGYGCQRWENASFKTVPAHVVRQAGFEPPPQLAELVARAAA